MRVLRLIHMFIYNFKLINYLIIPTSIVVIFNKRLTLIYLILNLVFCLIITI